MVYEIIPADNHGICFIAHVNFYIDGSVLIGDFHSHLVFPFPLGD